MLNKIKPVSSLHKVEQSPHGCGPCYQQQQRRRVERPRCGTGLQVPCLAESEVEEGRNKLGVVTARPDQDQPSSDPKGAEPRVSLSLCQSLPFTARKTGTLGLAPDHSLLPSPDGAGGGNAGELIHWEVAAGSPHLTLPIYS